MGPAMPWCTGAQLVVYALAFRTLPWITEGAGRAEAMMKRTLLCLFFLLSLDGSGFSQGTKSEPAFYVVLNSLTRNCTVVDKMPRTDTPNVTVASDTIYKTRAEAEMAVKTLAPCNQ